jgi:hypothetical protein
VLFVLVIVLMLSVNLNIQTSGLDQNIATHALEHFAICILFDEFQCFFTSTLQLMNHFLRVNRLSASTRFLIEV